MQLNSNIELSDRFFCWCCKCEQVHGMLHVVSSFRLTYQLKINQIISHSHLLHLYSLVSCCSHFSTFFRFDKCSLFYQKTFSFYHKNSIYPRQFYPCKNFHNISICFSSLYFLWQQYSLFKIQREKEREIERGEKERERANIRVSLVHVLIAAAWKIFNDSWITAKANLGNSKQNHE